MNPVTNRVYVANSGQRYRVDPRRRDGRGRPLASSGREDPEGIAVNPVTNRIYVANQAPIPW